MVDGCCCLRGAPCESFTAVSGSARRGQQLASRGQGVLLNEELLSTVYRQKHQECMVYRCMQDDTAPGQGKVAVVDKFSGVCMTSC